MSNDKDFVATFEKSNDYKRFVVTGVLTSINRTLCTVDLFEETQPMMKKYTVPKAGEATSEIDPVNLINIVHSSILIPPESLPFIINSLQGLYDKYKAGLNNGD